MDRRLGGPLPHQLPNPTRAHPCAINLWHLKHAIKMHYAVLSSVSRCYPPHKGRLLTRYSPVRHWSDPKVVTVRLECVMHAASVHPEPGSNSQTNCISSTEVVWFVWAIYSSFLYFFRVVFSLVLTDFCIRTCFFIFALYFYLLLFNCQGSIASTRFASKALLLYHILTALSIPFWKVF